MAISVTHTKVSALSDSADATQIQPSDWNGVHTIGGQGGAAATNTTNSTTAFANISGLSFEMEANKSYIIEALVAFQSSVTTTGAKFAINGPASPAAVAGQTHIPISLVAMTHGAFRAYDSGTASASVDIINSTLMAKIEAFVTNGANAGTLAIRFAAETTGTITVVGGRLRWHEV